MSPSLRGRGLKYEIITQFSQRHGVALFTRAWIEIHQETRAEKRLFVALFTRAWIEILGICICLRIAFGRPLYEGVD